MSLIDYLLLSLCLHACNARPLQLHDMENGGWLHISGKVATDEGKITLLSSFDTQILQEKDAMALGRLNEGNKGGNFAMSSAESIQKTAEVKEQRKQARLLKSKPDNAKEKERGHPREDDMGGDIVDMDYAQPHRKPPIHNMAP